MRSGWRRRGIALSRDGTARRFTRFPYPQIALLLLYAAGMVAIAWHGGIQ